MALRWTMDKVGVIARTAADTAMVLGAIYGPDARDETVIDADFSWTPAASLAGTRIGVVETELRTPPGGSASEDARRAERATLLADAMDVLRAAGASLVPVTLPDLPARAMYAVCNAEAGTAFDDLVRSGAVNRLADQTASGRANQLRWARFVPAVEYLRAQRIRTLMVQRMQQLFESVDLIVTPSNSSSVTMTNFTGHPAITVSCGLAGGLPVGLMLTGRYLDEARLVDAAHAYQLRTAWHRQRPGLA
jgi:Asp-tRNA(Asn)/Glu-tRNA(Gln) amidotransferase A subunit family amidase